MAQRFQNKSVAEQNSVELAWETLMLPDFEDLRACIYCNEEEFARFRQIIVNIVLATGRFYLVYYCRLVPLARLT